MAKCKALFLNGNGGERVKIMHFPKRKIRYNSLKISLPDVSTRLGLQSALFTVPLVLLSLSCNSQFH